MEQTPVKLGYWNVRGLGEKIRHIIEYCGLPYTQEVYRNPEDGDKWFKEDKPKLIEKNPAVSLPYLIDGDKVISESDAICIYICHRSKKVELLGRNPEEWVLTATVHGVFKDLHSAYIKLVYGTYADGNAFQAATKDVLPSFETHLKKLNGLLGEKEFIAGGLPGSTSSSLTSFRF